MTNQARLEANHNAYAKGQWGAPREGEATVYFIDGEIDRTPAEQVELFAFDRPL